MKIYAFCSDAENGKYRAVSTDDPNITGESHYSLDEAVGRLVREHPGIKVDHVIDLNAPAKPPLPPSEQTLTIPVEQLAVKVRMYNVLKNNGCQTIADVIAIPRDKWQHRTMHVGPASFRELVTALSLIGVSLGNGENNG